MQHRLTSIALFGFATFAIGCGLDSKGGGAGGTGVSGTGGVGSGGTGGVCVPGSAMNCVCPSGAFGAQLCQGNGFFSPCMCGTSGSGGFGGVGTGGAGIGGVGGFSGTSGSGGFGGVSGVGGGIGGIGGVGGISGFGGAGAIGGTSGGSGTGGTGGGDVDSGVMCPPCVPPPGPGCVGTGICGCGPYICLPSDQCSDVDGCTACAFPTEVFSSDDCYCAACPSTPMTISRCEANAASHDKFCTGLPIICPLIACVEPPETVCLEGTCAVASDTF